MTEDEARLQLQEIEEEYQTMLNYLNSRVSILQNRAKKIYKQYYGIGIGDIILVGGKRAVIKKIEHEYFDIDPFITVSFFKKDGSKSSITRCVRRAKWEKAND